MTRRFSFSAFALAWIAGMVVAAIAASVMFTRLGGPNHAAEGFGWSLIMLMFWLPPAAPVLLVACIALSALRRALDLPWPLFILAGAVAPSSCALMILSLMGIWAKTSGDDMGRMALTAMALAGMTSAAILHGGMRAREEYEQAASEIRPDAP